MNELKKMAKIYTTLEPWLKWWHSQCAHIFGPFRVAGLPGLNMSEIGNVGWKHNAPGKMRMVDACKSDVSTMLMQEEMIQLFNCIQSKSTGKGPTPAEKVVKERKQQMKIVQDFVKILNLPPEERRRAIALEAEQANNPAYFHPTIGASHRPHQRDNYDVEGLSSQSSIEPENAEVTSPTREPENAEVTSPARQNENAEVTSTARQIENEEANSTSAQDECTEVDSASAQDPDVDMETPLAARLAGKRGRGRGARGRGVARGRGRGCGLNTNDMPSTSNNTSQGCRRSLPEEHVPGSATKRCKTVKINKDQVIRNLEMAVQILTEHNELIPHTGSFYRPKNLPMIIDGSNTQIRKCQGCKGEITEQQKTYPNNLLFRKNGICTKLNERENRVMELRTNHHFHLNMGCLRRYDSTEEARNITMNVEVFAALDERQLCMLQDMGFLSHIAAKKM